MPALSVSEMLSAACPEFARDGHYWWGCDDGPCGPEDWFPVGTRVSLLHAFEGREFARGWVIDVIEGWYDFGSPESGPGPVEEATLLVIGCDDGKVRNMHPMNLDRLELREEDKA